MKKKDYIIIGSLFVVALIAFVWITFFNQSSGSIANVYVDDLVVASIDFSDDSYKLFDQDDQYPEIVVDTITKLEFKILGKYQVGEDFDVVVIEVDFVNNQIRIKSDGTPKQIGVNRGWYNGQGLPVISLPNQVIILFETKTDDVDGVV